MTDSQFEYILTQAQQYLTAKAKCNAKYFANISPENFEKEVKESLDAATKDTELAGTVKLIAGHRFPDIAVGENYGIEVKTAKSDHWKTLGNSVLESTRVPGVEKIYIFFAKLGEQTEFRFRKYQECLAEVQITHSPRYMIDMELPLGQSIFDKMGTEYDIVRNHEKPIVPFIDYYKKVLGPDTSVWWLNADSSEKALPIKMTFWSDVENDRQKILMGYMLFLFPEIFGDNDRIKYNRLVAWLVKNYSIVSPSMRDSFSAGGRYEIDLKTQKVSVPQVVKKLFKYKKEFKDALRKVDFSELKVIFNLPDTYVDSVVNRFSLWQDAFRDATKDNPDYTYDVKEYIFSQIKP